MATTMFSKQRGLLAVFPDPALPAATTLRISDWDGPAKFKCIITRINVATQGNYQFLHTLGGNVYVYVFGDKIGQIGISGLAFDSMCTNATDTLGVENIINYYNENRIVARKTPIKITIGVKTTLLAYLVAMSVDMVDPAAKLYQFSMQLALVPQNSIPCSTKPEKADEKKKEDKKVTIGVKEPAPVAGDTFPATNGLTTINSDGSTSGNSLIAVTSTGFSSYGTGPNIEMTKAQQS
jgi:hypothetical protein